MSCDFSLIQLDDEKHQVDFKKMMVLIKHLHYGLPVSKSHGIFLMQMTHIKVEPARQREGTKLSEESSQRLWGGVNR